MSSQTSIADVPTSTEQTVTPTARKRLGWMSVGYFPKERTRNADGQSFTAHDFSIRYSYRKDDKIEHIDLTIPRNQALNLAECLREVYSQSYELHQGDQDEE